MTEKKEFSTVLTRANEAYFPLIEKQLKNNAIEFTDYAKKCVMNSIASMNQLLANQGINWNDPSLDQGNLTHILYNVASLELNPFAEPAECYFQIRNVKRGDAWKKVVEFGIEGDGYDSILARFGRDIEKVNPYWLVREDDHFEYPKFNGLEMTPPVWEPKGTGKVVRVVYPIVHKDKTIHFYISEREDVKKNLMAHINNNLMNETFGICKDRYNATDKQKAEIEQKKRELKTKAKTLGFKAIEDPEISQYISPAWKEDYASEQMIIRKMRNNITKKIPKAFGNPAVQESYDEVTNESYYSTKQEIVEKNAVIDVEPIAPQNEQNGAEPHESTHSKGEISVEREIDLKTEIRASDADIENRAKPDFD